jgi:RNA polymerase-binding transcription factor DksA
MAKSTKKTPSKRTAGKSSSKALERRKKAASKNTKVKKSAGKKPAAKKITGEKKTRIMKSSKKSTDTKQKQKRTMAKRIKKKEEVNVENVLTQTETSAETRTKNIEKIKGYGPEDLEHFRKIILDKRDEIIDQLQNLKDQMLDPTTGEYINENSPYSLHMAEQGTDAMEREKTFLYAQRENKFLGYLEDALKRIDAGTYGICIECIEEPQHLCETCPLIPKARLEAVPHSQLCLPIKQRQEKR